MKKKYIKCRLGLLIGLLSLNILSSCVKTGQELGMGPWLSKDGKNNNVEEGRNKDSSNNFNPKQIMKLSAVAATAAAVGGTTGYYGGRSSGYSTGYSDAMSKSNNCSNWPSNNSSYSNFTQAESKWNSTSKGKGTIDFGDPYAKRKK